MSIEFTKTPTNPPVFPTRLEYVRRDGSKTEITVLPSGRVNGDLDAMEAAIAESCVAFRDEQLIILQIATLISLERLHRSLADK